MTERGYWGINQMSVFLTVVSFWKIHKIFWVGEDPQGSTSPSLRKWDLLFPKPISACSPTSTSRQQGNFGNTHGLPESPWETSVPPAERLPLVPNASPSLLLPQKSVRYTQGPGTQFEAEVRQRAAKPNHFPFLPQDLCVLLQSWTLCVGASPQQPLFPSEGSLTRFRGNAAEIPLHLV